MDRVVIEDLQVDAIIGIHDWERAGRQPLRFDIEMTVDNRAAAASDAIADAIDYFTVAARVTALVVESRCELLETLVERIAALVLRDFPCAAVTVRVRKPRAIANARHAAIEIHRERA